MAEMTKKPTFGTDLSDKTFQRTNSEPPPPMNAKKGSSESKGGSGPGLNEGIGNQMARSAEGFVSSEFEKKASQGAEGLGDVAKMLHRTSEDLEGNLIGPYIGKAADQIDRVSNFLRTAEVKDVVKSVEDFARREPLIFLGGAFAAGILASRFAKSTAETGNGAE